MLLVEDALPLLLDTLRRMPSRDRRAILAKLSDDERDRLARFEGGGASDIPKPAHSADIQARLTLLRAGKDQGMTSATAEALRRLLDIASTPATPPRKSRPTTSLMDSVAGMLRRGAGAA